MYVLSRIKIARVKFYTKKEFLKSFSQKKMFYSLDSTSFGKVVTVFSEGVLYGLYFSKEDIFHDFSFVNLQIWKEKNPILEKIQKKEEIHIGVFGSTFSLKVFQELLTLSSHEVISYKELMMTYPLGIGGICILASIIGTFFVRLGPKKSIMGALYKGFFTTAFISAIAIGIYTYLFLGFKQVTYHISDTSFTGVNLFLCVIIGLIVTGFLIWITEYYTSSKFRPVQSIAHASTTGHATNIISGLSVSLEATVLPVLVISGGILLSYLNAELFGVAIAATSMLALAGMIVALDSYGPVTDNAGGIAEMAKLPEKVRKITDALDSVGNTTKAVTKGYAIASAGFGSLVLFAAFIEDLHYYFPNISQGFMLQDPYVVIGLFIGGLLPYLFGGLGLRSVGKAAASIVNEVRRQFKEIPGIMKGKSRPDYGKAVDLLTKSAIREMIVPSLLPVLSPIIIFFIINFIAGHSPAFICLGSMLLGVVITGLFVALSMTSGGGAWDNAKKYIEEGNYGGKGSESHKAAVTGDTVGDPYKDTVGPAVNPLIKIANIAALLLLAILSRLLLK
jgi:K(+)-stimulated pyrophosphate-energized sodium pump